MYYNRQVIYSHRTFGETSDKYRYNVDKYNDHQNDLLKKNETNILNVRRNKKEVQQEKY